VAAALGIGAKGTQFFYLSAGARDYGLTVGTRDSEKISLTELGRTAVFPASPVEAIEAKRKAFLSIDVFRRVLDHYRGNHLPEMEYLSNTLTKEFGLAPDIHEEFVNVFTKNCRYLEIIDWDGTGASSGRLDTNVSAAGPAVITIAQSKRQTGLFCFV